MEKAIQVLQTTILVVLTLFVFISVLRMIYAIFSNCNFISDYIGAIVFITLPIGLMCVVAVLLIKSKKES